MSSSAPASSLPPTAPVLVERERELHELAGLVRDALAGEGRLVLIEGPAGIGKSRLLAEAAPRGPAAGALVLAAPRRASSSASSRSASCASCSRRVAGDPRARDAASRARRRRRARRARRAATRPARRGDASFAALHGLYWLTLNLAGARPLVLAIDDLQWCDRAVAALRRLPGAPARGPAGAASRATLRTGEPATDAALLAEIAHDPATRAVRPAPARRRGRGRALVARAARRRARPRVLRRLPRAPRAATRCCCASSLDGAGGRRRAARRRARRRRARRSARARSRAPCCCGSRACRARRSRSPAPSPCSATSAELAGGRRADRTSTRRRWPRPPRALARADILRARRRRSASSTRSCATRSTASSPPARARARARARPRGCCATPARPPEQVAAQLLHAPPRAATRGSCDALREAGAAGARRGARRERGRLPAARARGAADAPSAARAPAASSALAEALTDGPAAAEHLRERLRRARRPAAIARRRGRASSRGCCFTRPRRREAVRCRARGRRELPERRRRRARAAGGRRARSPVFFGAIGDRRRCERLHAYRDAAPRGATARARRCSPAIAAWDWTHGRPAGATQCCELALAALAGGELLESRRTAASRSRAAASCSRWPTARRR